MFTLLIQRYGIAGLFFCAGLSHPWGALAKSRIDAGSPDFNIPITVEGDIVPDCTLSSPEATINMGTVQLVPDGKDFPEKPITSSTIIFSGDCLKTSGAYISVDGDATSDADSSIFLNNLSGEGAAEGVGAYVSMYTTYSKGTNGTFEHIKSGEKYPLQSAADIGADDTLSLDFSARLVYLQNAAAAKPGNYQSVITINLMIP